MKLAIAIQKLDAAHGGAESWTIQLAHWLLQRGHDIDFFCMRSSLDHGFDEQRIHTLANSNSRWTASEELALRLQEHRFDIVHDMGLGTSFDVFQSHFGSLKAMEIGKCMSHSLFRRLANNVASPFAFRKQRLGRLATAQFGHPSAWYIAVSKMVAHGLQHYEGISPHRIFCVANGINASRYHPDKLKAMRDQRRSYYSLEADELVLASMAHNHRLKGIPQLVQTLVATQDFPIRLHLLVVGGHQQSPRRVKLGNHKVTYVGAIHDAMDAYAAADVYVHPTFYDACSLTVLEAMACGLPTVTTRSNGASERIEHGVNGFLIESAWDTAGLIYVLRQLNCIELRKSMGGMARAEAEKWTLEDNFLAIEMLYRAKCEARWSERVWRERGCSRNQPSNRNSSAA